MKKLYYISIALSTLAAVSCKPKIKAPSASLGSIDPTRYVAIGNSITSGYADGALYYDGQQTSYPNLIAQQFSVTSGTSYSFKQPLMPAGSIGCGTADSAGVMIFPGPLKLAYAADCLGATSLMPVPFPVGDKQALLTNIYTSQGPFNNMGVPGAKVIDLMTLGYGYPGAGNPLFTRMAKDPNTSSILGDALMLNPTFFSVFMGNNDALIYATNGAANGTLTPSSGSVGVGFDATYDSLINALTHNGAKGVIANIPDITALPYFTTVPWNGLTIPRQGQADSLTAWQTGFYPNFGYTFSPGNNPFVIYDQSVPSAFHCRVIKPNELILLTVPLDSIKCHGMGSIKGIPNKYVLTETEILNIRTAIASYNAHIKSVADAKGLAFVDVNAFMQQAQKGIVYNGITINTLFVTGGSFSLDGIHLNPLGNAMLANEFIKAINQTYNATIPLVDPTKYRGCIFP